MPEHMIASVAAPAFRLRLRRAFAVLLGILVLAAPALAASERPVHRPGRIPERQRPDFPVIDLGIRQAGGRDAVTRLGRNLPTVADWYGLTADQLREDLLKDRMLRLDRGGRLLFVEELGAAVRAEQVPFDVQSPVHSGALVALDRTFLLHSHPRAKQTIYLNFTGATISGTAWNSGSTPIVAQPYDFDGNPAAFSDAERQRIQYIWQRVAEDYAPFDVDVTTQKPPPDRLTRSDANDPYYGTTVVITRMKGVYSCSCGGIAYVGIFNAYGARSDYFKPAFVFFDMLGAGSEKPVAEAISHEAGHNMGLHHDGTTGQEYYPGHGADARTGWAPIMGSGYYKPLTQFSKGEYAGARNREDDFIVAQNFGLPLRLDDHGDTIATATPFPTQVAGGVSTGAIDGIIGSAQDRDVFELLAGPGKLTVAAMPATRSANLDIMLSLLDSRGNVLARANPPDALDAALTYTIAAQGSYFLEVRGTGKGDPATNGYSSYGSVGNFRLSASHAAPSGTPPTAVLAATPSTGLAPLAVKLDGRQSHDAGRVAFWYWDFGDGSSDVSGGLSAVTHVYKSAGRYLVRLKVVNDKGLSASTTQVVAVDAATPQSSVSNIRLTTKTNSRGFAWAVAVVTIADPAGKPLGRAKVAANWGGLVSQTASKSTGKTGTVIFTSPKTKANGCFNLTIANVTSAGYPFNAASDRTAQICR